MADISFSCPNCGQVLEAPEDMAGQTVECPACQQPIEIPPLEAGQAAEPADDSGGETPEASPEGEGEPEQEAAPESAATPEEEPAPEAPSMQVCPSCKKPMDPDAVLCMSCGYHCKLGKKIETSLG